MRKPTFGKQRSASGAFSLSRRLPRLSLPHSAATVPVTRPKPQVGRPGNPVRPALPPSALPPSTVPQASPASPVRSLPAAGPVCSRCGHVESDHPLRYACDKYPHPDPLQICGCEAESPANPCPHCGHSGRRHKPRHRCLHGDGCHCWGYAEQ